jgi:probable rRNA maturation factor
MRTIQIRSDSRYPVERERLRSVVEKALQMEGLVSELTVSLVVVGTRQMKKINATFHHEDRVTDVLSFPFLDPSSNPHQTRFVLPPGESQVLGEVIVCYPEAVRQAREKGVLVDEEMDFLVAHGMQHLLGHHHE